MAITEALMIAFLPLLQTEQQSKTFFQDTHSSSAFLNSESIQKCMFVCRAGFMNKLPNSHHRRRQPVNL